MTSSSIQQSVEPRALVEVATMVRRWDISQGIDANLADLAATALRPLAIKTSSNPGTSGTYFPFRPLEKIPAAEDAVNAWMENRSNIERAGINLKENTTVKPRSYLSAWCPIVINTMPRTGTLRGIAPDKKGQAIIIALGKLDHTNGLFLGKDIELYSGQDVIFGGGESITFSGEGGGLALLLFLNT
ncbi:hypothetical protein TEQG_08344 [Trichophyton equinum CBS 127.97]|uniref:Uncharacterized protein n=1 Tax=Trichophyton equinum (strain ATCC MYA-4606 / CBS 127.97) TaxID=559882 RepID=F2Q5M5_TRIEC|nr:hypothetical protein TEQG_08344 [Trichophyton equinum CBS 127.97]